MRCPNCGHEKQRIVDSRPFGEETRRKRICKKCHHKFITYERVEDDG